MSQGLNFNTFFNEGMSSISSKGADLQAQMAALSSKPNVGPEDLLPIQFEMGQYTAFLQTASSMTQSISDTLKSVAQHSG